MSAWFDRPLTAGLILTNACHFTQWLDWDFVNVTFISQGYIYRLSDNARIGSGATTPKCNIWIC
jgi:hypothetical protein